MGRYYSGDIEGKFWFAVQSSDDAEHFGVEGNHPEEIEYCFEEENIPDVKAGIKKCKDFLLGHEEKITSFFKEKDTYTDQELADYLHVTKQQAKELLTVYARLELGLKILKCLEENKSCYFTAEC